MKSTIKSTIMIIGAIFAAPNAFAGFCVNNRQFMCMVDADCPGDDICLETGLNGPGGSCRDSTHCKAGYYCKITGGTKGVCTIIPDCDGTCDDCVSTAIATAHAMIAYQPPGRLIPRDTKSVPPQNVIHRHAYAVKTQNTDARPDIMAPPQMANLVVRSARHQTEYRPHQTPAQHLSHNAICHLAQPALTPPAHLYTQQTAIIKNTQTSRNRGMFFYFYRKIGISSE